MIKTLSLAFWLCFIAISGCQTISNQPLPQWVTSPQLSEEKFYAIGEGVSLKEAQTNAKEALAAQLLSHISSELDVLAIHDGDFNREYVEKRTLAHVNKVALPNVEILKQQKVGYHFYAQAMLNKEQLKSFLEEKLKQQKANAQLLIQDAKRHTHSFDRWWFLTKHQSEINHFSDQTLIFNSLFTPKKQNYVTLTQQFSKLQNNARQSLKLAIKDSTPIKGLQAEVEKQLSQHKISKDESWFGKQPTIKLKTSIKTKSLFNEYYSNAKLIITLSSKSGQVLATHTIDARSVSVVSSSDAKQKSYHALLKKFKKLDIIKTLKSA